MKFVTCLLLIFVFSLGNAQERKDRRLPSYFGFQIKPIFPTQFIGESELTLQKDNFITTISQRPGYSFGATVRVGLTELLSLETGISFVRRNFHIDMAVPDSAVAASNSLEFINYDIPVNGLIYVKLSEQWYMNASLGVSLNFKPTHVIVTTQPSGLHMFSHLGYVPSRLSFGLNANFGFEFRTEKKGFFYLGGSAFVPFDNLFDFYAEYKYQGIYTEAYGKVDGSYLTLDFKYFFPNIRKKGKGFNQGPID